MRINWQIMILLEKPAILFISLIVADFIETV